MNSKEALKKAWSKLKEEEPKLRIKNAADKLGVTEVELLATQDDVTRLNEDWPGIFKAVESLGYVMALTRNESVVHERKGEYHNISFNPHVGLVLDPNIDLRIFPGRFGSAFAVPVQSAKGVLHSIQFFDTYGVSAHKIYLLKEENLPQYNELVETFKNEDQEAELKIKEAEAPKEFELNPDVDKEAFLADWGNLKDTHDFYPLLRKYKLERTQALAIAEGTFTQKVENSVTETMLNRAAEQEVPIMVFVGSKAVIQIHSGVVSNIKKMDNWLNVLDPEFNLHLQADHITDTWIVRKPTEDGIVTSVEIFEKDHNDIATFFGARKPGIPELESWKNLVATLEEESQLV